MATFQTDDFDAAGQPTRGGTVDVWQAGEPGVRNDGSFGPLED
jgi:protocatechuate 3,4-dioxygenase beta subunit